MGKITDLNVTGLETGRFAGELLGTAHTYVVAGIPMRLGFYVSVAGRQAGAYDLIISGYANGAESKAVLLRAKIKTCEKANRIQFMGGRRVRVSRKYRGVEEYKYTTEDNDLIIGIQRDTLDFYLVPTRFVARFGRSKDLRKLAPLKNNWEILLNWRGNYLQRLFNRLAR